MLRSHRNPLALASVGLLACLAGYACRANARADRAAGARDSVIGGPVDTGVYSSVGRDSTHPNRLDTLTDGDIAVLVVTANSIDSSAGAYARTRTRTAAVREFATRMVREHGAANRQAAALAHRLSPPMSTPHENADVRTLRSRAEDAKAALARDSGATFDRKYIEQAVKDHQDLLDRLDRELIPRAQDAALKELLTQQRAGVNAHLQEAKRIEDMLHG